MLILPSDSVGLRHQLFQTQRHDLEKLPGKMPVWLSQCPRLDQTEVRSWWWRWVSLQLFGLSPWDLCPLWSRHRAAGLTLGHTLYAAWIPCWTPPASHLTPHHLMSLLLSLPAHPSHPWSIIPGHSEQIILKIVHCNWPRTLARLSYLNISTKHVWNRTLTGTFCKYRAERGGREAAAGLANTITARGRTSGQTAACSSLIWSLNIQHKKLRNL